MYGTKHQSKVAKAGYFNLDFDRDDFEELSRGYIPDSVALCTVLAWYGRSMVLVLLRLCYNDIHFLECAKL